jgi:hypothetical protein
LCYEFNITAVHENAVWEVVKRKQTAKSSGLFFGVAPISEKPNLSELQAGITILFELRNYIKLIKHETLTKEN